ncbi:MAG TPA: DUF2442 domain-containing protein [Chitinophagaceae bacterium]|nr:DUF2442 domain-containing protein [Chitinophagaceae bacterium]
MKKLTRFKKLTKKAAKAKPAKKTAKKVAVKKKADVKNTIHPKKQTRQSSKSSKLRLKNKRIVYKDAIINNATFLHDYVLLVTFSDGHKQTVDFAGFLNAESTPKYMKKYKSESKFKSFKVEHGNLVWGKDWDLVFPLAQLYVGRIN